MAVVRDEQSSLMLSPWFLLCGVGVLEGLGAVFADEGCLGLRGISGASFRWFFGS